MVSFKIHFPTSMNFTCEILMEMKMQFDVGSCTNYAYIHSDLLPKERCSDSKTTYWDAFFSINLLFFAMYEYRVHLIHGK